MDDSNSSTGVESPLVNNFVNGFVDYKGRPVLRSQSGGWRSAYFIMGVEVAERIAYYGVGSNLITYLTGPLGQSTSRAAANVNAWNGTSMLLPLVGAFIADAFLGRFLTIIISSLLYILALALLAFSTLLPSSCEGVVGVSSYSPQLQVILFFISLYSVAFAQGGFKPCVQAFGADQFSTDNLQECQAKSSFFNWWNFALSVGPMFGIFVLSYVQDNLSWGLGFGIPSIIMVFSLITFLIGTRTYRFENKMEERSALVRIGQVFVKAAQNWRTTPSTIFAAEEACGILPYQGSQQFKFLNKALLSPTGANENGTLSGIKEVDEAKAVLRLFPIWVSCLGYGVVFSQISTLYTKQGATRDRSIGSSFQIPAATLQTLISMSFIILIPIYDTIMVPLTRAFTRRPSGITMLQRVGTGFFISIPAMVVAAMVETKRLKTARDYTLLDDPAAIVPMKIWWLLPQYLLAGTSDVFMIVGLQEFFYDQMPSDLRSIGLALYLSVMGIGNFLSSFLISIIEKTTGGYGRDGWISDNINQGHLDYFYYLLAGISAGAFIIYIYAARSYVYNAVPGD